MAISQEKIRAAYRRRNRTIERLAFNIYAAAASGEDGGLPESARTLAFLLVYDAVFERTKGRPDIVQANAARVWSGMSGAEKRDLAGGSMSADAVITDAMAADPALAARLTGQEKERE